MAKIKHTKTELKAQRESLGRYERFLPMLQLKKQQLQVEVQATKTKRAANEGKMAAIQRDLSRWIHLIGEPVGLENYVAIQDIKVDQSNIAGVNIPVLKDVELKRSEHDLFDTPPWTDEAIEIIGQMIHLRVEHEILAEQERLIAEELRTTSQRVNLFEKVKIPECKENIRVIKIFLGDEQTAAVARGKLAKKRSQD